MTEENFNYRTSPLFLRNAFNSKDKWKIPVIPKCDLNITSNEDLRVIGFDRVKNNKDTHYNRLVHFFLYDYEFEKIWVQPQKYVDILKQYKGILSPDFSMYIEMNPVMQLYNTFRNRWVGAYLASKGIKVIPTVNWGLENTFDFCFNGIEKGETVAVSTYMVNEHGHHKDQRDFFLKGYNEMLKRIEPELVICYSEPFPEMEGNILYINYDLSSWRHYGDDEVKGKTHTSSVITKYHSGYVLPYDAVAKGTGSAFGGEWRPKKPADERFLGEPGEVKETWIPTKNGGYLVRTKIGANGKAEKERHYTDHFYPSKHTDPHDHEIDWSNNYPNPGPPINYYDPIPEFKNYRKAVVSNMILDGFSSFDSISDFKLSLIRGREIQFCWNDVYYCAFREGEGEDIFSFSEAYKPETELLFHNVDDLLNTDIQGQKLRDIVTQVEVCWRNL